MIGPGLSEPQTGFSMVLQMASLFIPMSAETEIYYLCTTSNVYTYIYIYLHTFALDTYIVIPQKIEKSIPISQMTIHKHCHFLLLTVTTHVIECLSPHARSTIIRGADHI